MRQLAVALALLLHPSYGSLSTCITNSSLYCASSPPPPSAASDACFLRCCACETPSLLLGLSAPDAAALCHASPPPAPAASAALIATAIISASESLLGYWLLSDPGDFEANATAALAHLLGHMPKRDALATFERLWGGGGTSAGAEFLLDTVRDALAQWPRLAGAGVPWRVFLDGVLPHGVLNEKRDWGWRWRPRFAQLFAGAWANASTAGAAMRALAAMIPDAAPGFVGALLGGPGGGAPASYPPGRPIQWRSSTSPGFLSPEQVAGAFGSCTGTGILLVAAARAIGIPARLAGCSQTDVPGDDHHWAEYYDSSDPGPFGTYWHTKEGVSKGNEGGPWDSPSGPMLGCLRGVIPGSPLNTMWASAWGSDVFLPTLWGQGALPAGEDWAWVGGENVCGAYCTSWGCGVNNSNHWTQAECQ